MKKHLHSITFIYALFFTSSGIYSQITAYPDTAVCPGQPVTLFADAADYCGDCYIYHEIPYAIEPIGGTTFSMFDDTHTSALNIGFTFCFFGNDYTQFYLNANGWISFEEPTYDMDINWTPDEGIPVDSADVAKNAIFSPWKDWNPGLCIDCLHYETAGAAPYRKCIITWAGVPMYWCGTEGTFQIVLCETTNEIYNHFQQVDVCEAWGAGFGIQGMQNITGDIAFTVDGRNATPWSAENESWLWNTSDITWYKGATPIGTGSAVTVSPVETTVYTVVQTFCDGTEYTDEVTVEMLISGGCDSVITTNCDLITHLETLDVDTISASVIWNSVSDADSYIVQYKKEASLTWNMFTVTDTSALLSDLEECTNYICRIGYICVGDTIFSTESVIFTTDCLESVSTENKTLFTIAPNPADDYFILQMSGKNNIACSIIVYNTYGEKVLEKNMAPGTASIVIPVDGLVAGAYILSLQNNMYFVSKVLMIK